VTVREFTLTVTALQAGFDWSTPAVGAVSNISTNTINSVATSFTGTAGATRGLYRDSGITYSPSVGEKGTVWVNSGGHNDHNSNATFRFDCKTGTWSQWKAPATVFRETSGSNYESESTRGFALSTTAIPLTDGNARDPDGIYSQQTLVGSVRTGQPGSTHSYSHLLVIPPGIISGGAVLWRYSAALGWSIARAAQYPGHWTDLNSASNPWTHFGDYGRTGHNYVNGSAYYNGKVYAFEGTTSRTAYVFDLANPAASTSWQYGTSFQGGSAWVNPGVVTDANGTYFMLLSGGPYASPAFGVTLRLINVTTGVVTAVAITGDALDPLDQGYYSVCWSEEKRAVYMVAWRKAGLPEDHYSPGVNTTTNYVYKIAAPAAPASLTGAWTRTKQITQDFLVPNTGSQMKPRSFYVNGCILNFPATDLPVQAIGVD
jgi:hypothetical protein